MTRGADVERQNCHPGPGLRKIGQRALTIADWLPDRHDPCCGSTSKNVSIRHREIDAVVA